MRVPESIRELRSHFVFWVLEKLAGAAVIAAILAAFQWVRQHVDIVTIAVVFLGSLLTLMFLDRLKGRVSAPSALSQPEAPPPNPANAAALIANWRTMVTDVRKLSRDQGRSTADVIVEHPAFPSIRPYLGEQAKNILNTSRFLLGSLTINRAVMDTFLDYVLDDIDRMAKEWEIDKPVPQSIPRS
jgi:hypothetical protein